MEYRPNRGGRSDTPPALPVRCPTGDVHGPSSSRTNNIGAPPRSIERNRCSGYPPGAINAASIGRKNDQPNGLRALRGSALSLGRASSPDVGPASGSGQPYATLCPLVDHSAGALSHPRSALAAAGEHDASAAALRDALCPPPGERLRSVINNRHRHPTGWAIGIAGPPAAVHARRRAPATPDPPWPRSGGACRQAILAKTSQWHIFARHRSSLHSAELIEQFSTRRFSPKLSR